MALLNHAYAKCFHFYLSFLFGVFIISLKVNNALCVFLCPSPIVSIFTLLQFLRYFQRFSATDRTSQSHFPLHLLNASERQLLISALKTSLLPTLCMFPPPASFLRQTSCPRCLPHLLSLFLGFSPQSTEATADQHFPPGNPWRVFVTKPMFQIPFLSILASAQRVLWKDLSAVGESCRNEGGLSWQGPLGPSSAALSQMREGWAQMNPVLQKVH